MVIKKKHEGSFKWTALYLDNSAPYRNYICDKITYNTHKSEYKLNLGSLNKTEGLHQC